MNGYTIRQGTVYRHRVSGDELLIFNHDPMRLRSLAVRRVDDSWDARHPGEITIDTLAAMRKSDEFEDAGDVSPEERDRVLDQLLALPGLPEIDRQLLASIRSEGAPEKNG